MTVRSRLALFFLGCVVALTVEIIMVLAYFHWRFGTAP